MAAVLVAVAALQGPGRVRRIRRTTDHRSVPGRVPDLCQGQDQDQDQNLSRPELPRMVVARTATIRAMAITELGLDRNILMDMSPRGHHLPAPHTIRWRCKPRP